MRFDKMMNGLRMISLGRCLRDGLTAVSLLVVILVSEAAAAELYRRVSFMVRPEAVVRGEQITLGEISKFGATEKEFDVLLQSLKSLKIADSPAPKTRVNILGATILARIEEAGFPKEQIGYAIPRSITVERDGRSVTKDEVLAEVKARIWERKTADIQVRDVDWASTQIVPIGSTVVKVEILGEPMSGKIPLRAEILVDEKPAARFLATAIADDWREIPVVNRDIDRGALINPEDLQLVRINLAQHPTDTVSNAKDLFGMRAKAKISAGEVVRKSEVDIPPVIAKGKRIVVTYDRGLLRATATGIALEDGFEGSRITIRNELSKKIVMGRVKNAEEAVACN